MNQQNNTHRVHNFAPGPGCIPVEVLQEVQNEFLSYQNTGMSFMEMSHRIENGPVQSIIQLTADLVRELLNVPNNYHILFLHGGAHGQFAGLPMNLAYESGKIDYVNSGSWSVRAMTQSSKYCDVHCCATFTNNVLPVEEWNYRPDAGYIHICLNETRTGIEYLVDPILPPDAPILVADATSTLFSRPVNINAYGCIFCSSGKNIGPPGITVVIVRKDLLERIPHPHLPGILDLREAFNSHPIHSIYNTPPCFQIYMTHKILSHAKQQLGSMESIERRAKTRAELLYDVIDNQCNGFYTNSVKPSSRSRMNICFSINSPNRIILEQKFIDETEQNGLFHIFKYPANTTLRIAIYNGLSDDSISAVATYLIKFAQENSNSLIVTSG